MAATPQKSWTRWLPVMIPYGWLLFFFLVPFLIVAKISISTTETAIPPYTPVFDPFVDALSGMWEKARQFTSENYARLIADRSLLARLSLESVDRARVDVPDAADRLPHGLRHGAGAGPLAAAAAHAGDPAVLDQLPDPGLRLDRHPLDRGVSQQFPDFHRRHQRAAVDTRDQHRRLHRHRLFIPALHGAAALLGLGEDG